MIKDQLNFRFNYTFTRIKDEVLVRILKQFYENLGFDIVNLKEEALRSVRMLKTQMPQQIINILKHYNGKYKNDIHITKAHNLVPDILREELATLLAGTTVTPTFKANYVALGSDATSPANDDTQLGTETLRGLFTNRYAIDNVAYLDKFFSSSEVGGNTYLEAGVFVDGTSSPNSGYLLSHVNMNETMTATESLTINSTITIS